MSRQKTQNQVTHTQVKNTRKKHDTALKKKKMKTICQSKMLTRISTGKWDLVTMKKKALGRNTRVKRETDFKIEVVVDLEKETGTTVIVTSPDTKQMLMREKGVKREIEAEVQRNPKTNLSTDKR